MGAPHRATQQHTSLTFQTHREASWRVGLSPIPSSEVVTPGEGHVGFADNSSTCPTMRASRAARACLGRGRPGAWLERSESSSVHRQVGRACQGDTPPMLGSLVIGSTGFCFFRILHGKAWHPHPHLCKRPPRHRASRASLGEMLSVHPHGRAPSTPLGVPLVEPVWQAGCPLQAPDLICNLGSWGHSSPVPPSSSILMGGLAAQGSV